MLSQACQAPFSPIRWRPVLAKLTHPRFSNAARIFSLRPYPAITTSSPTAPRREVPKDALLRVFPYSTIGQSRAKSSRRRKNPNSGFEESNHKPQEIDDEGSPIPHAQSGTGIQNNPSHRRHGGESIRSATLTAKIASRRGTPTGPPSHHLGSTSSSYHEEDLGQPDQSIRGVHLHDPYFPTQDGPGKPLVAGRSPAHEDDGTSPTDQANPAYTADVVSDEILLSQLPDLTKGLPLTLEYESPTLSTSALTRAKGDEAGLVNSGRGDRQDSPSAAYILSTTRRRRQFTRYLLSGFGLFSLLGLVYLGRDWDSDGEARHPNASNGWGIGLWWTRAILRLSELASYYRDPAFEKLLPDPPPLYARPYTLCIGLEDLLVHSEWSREHGWRLAKRPGLDYFIRYLSQYYEIVIFTTISASLADPIIRKIDPFRLVYPLFREATKWKDGEPVKDISYLNRDPAKVILLDTSPQSVSCQPENAILLPKWGGNPSDAELVALIPFLEYTSAMGMEDVRKVLKSFEGKHIPTEFARREAIARKQFSSRRDVSKKKDGRSFGFPSIGNALGFKSPSTGVEGEVNPTEAFLDGKMIQDLIREQGQKSYEYLERQIKENGEKWMKEEAAAQEKAQKEFLTSLKGWVTGIFPFASQDTPKSPS